MIQNNTDICGWPVCDSIPAQSDLALCQTPPADYTCFCGGLRRASQSLSPCGMPPFAPCCAHDHECADEGCGAAYSLYKHIDLPRVSKSTCFAVHRRWLRSNALCAR